MIETTKRSKRITTTTQRWVSKLLIILTIRSASMASSLKMKTLMESISYQLDTAYAAIKRKVKKRRKMMMMCGSTTCRSLTPYSHLLKLGILRINLLTITSPALTYSQLFFKLLGRPSWPIKWCNVSGIIWVWVSIILILKSQLKSWKS